MFWVINKDKLLSYLIVVCVIGVLIFLGANLPQKTVETVKMEDTNYINTTEQPSG
ncbi:MAG: hypothetical protein FWF46_03205 [Oscillospiraceae bacterium]|nr:hypothetical protein [Oscillospiraceae bacterium]